MTLTLVLSGLLIGLLGNAVKALAAGGSFALTGSLNTARYDHTATLLPGGEVLAATYLEAASPPGEERHGDVSPAAWQN